MVTAVSYLFISRIFFVFVAAAFNKGAEEQGIHHPILAALLADVLRVGRPDSLAHFQRVIWLEAAVRSYTSLFVKVATDGRKRICLDGSQVTGSSELKAYRLTNVPQDVLLANLNGFVTHSQI